MFANGINKSEKIHQEDVLKRNNTTCNIEGNFAVTAETMTHTPMTIQQSKHKD